MKTLLVLLALSIFIACVRTDDAIPDAVPNVNILTSNTRCWVHGTFYVTDVSTDILALCGHGKESK